MEPVSERKCSGGLSPARGREAPLYAAGRITVARAAIKIRSCEFKRLCPKKTSTLWKLCVLWASVVKELFEKTNTETLRTLSYISGTASSSFSTPGAA